MPIASLVSTCIPLAPASCNICAAGRFRLAGSSLTAHVLLMYTIDDRRPRSGPATEAACVAAVESTDLVRRLSVLDPVERDQVTTAVLAYLIGAVVEHDCARVDQAAQTDRLRGELDVAALHLAHMRRQLDAAGLPDTFDALPADRRARSRDKLTVPMITDDVAVLLHALSGPYRRAEPELFEQTTTGAITSVPREPEDDDGVDDVGVLAPADPLVSPASLDTGALPVMSDRSRQVPAQQLAAAPVTLEKARALDLDRVGRPQPRRWWQRREKT